MRNFRHYVTYLRATTAWPTQHVLRYLLVPLLVAVTTLALQLPVNLRIDPLIVGLLYLVPVLISAAVVGWLGGIGASLLSFLAFNYFFIPPYHTFVVADPSDTLALFVFLIVAASVSYLVGRLRAEAIRVGERERELTILYDLSKTVGRQVGLETMLRTIAERVCQLFPGSRAEVWLKNDAAKLELLAQAGASGDDFPKPHEALIRSEQAALGILKLYRRQPQPIGQSEQLLLNAVAAQTAIAVERAQLAQEATRAKVLAESDRLKAALLSSVSHDLRTPLATIKAAVTSLLQRDVQWDEDALVDQLNAINEESDRLNQVIGNLLSMSRIEAGAVQLQKRPYALQEVIGSVLRRLAPRTQTHIIQTHIPADLPLVPLDYATFEQIIINLVDNAVKYSPPGSEVSIAARTVGQFVEIGVSDHGCGLPSEAQQAVFEKFYRAPNGQTVPGSGLGLSIVKGFVEAHGGKTWISSRPGAGTSVKFVLPLNVQTVER